MTYMTTKRLINAVKGSTLDDTMIGNNDQTSVTNKTDN